MRRTKEKGKVCYLKIDLLFFYSLFQRCQTKKTQKGNMGNEHNQKIITLQGSIVPSMPCGHYPNGSISLLQLLSHLNSACKPFGNFTYHLQHPKTPPQCCLPFCIKLHPLSTIAYHLMQSFLVYKLLLSSVSLLLLSYIICYLFVVANSLLFQRLPLGMPPYFLL